MNIAIAGGKGGADKTTISMSLAACYSNNGIGVALLDCDLEEHAEGVITYAPRGR